MSQKQEDPDESGEINVEATDEIGRPEPPEFDADLRPFREMIGEEVEKIEEALADDGERELMAVGLSGVYFDHQEGTHGTIGGRFLNHEFQSPEGYPEAGLWAEAFMLYNNGLAHSALDIGLDGSQGPMGPVGPIDLSGLLDGLR